MWIRRLHRIVGLVFGPFVLITAITGGVLLFRRDVDLGPELKHDMLGWHNWEGLADYAGLALAAALVWMVVTGYWLWLATLLRKRRARKS